MKEKYKKFELEDCECGHTVPIDFVLHDKEGCGTCMPCVIENMNEIIKRLKKKKKQAGKVCCRGNLVNGFVEMCPKCLHTFSKLPC